MNKEEALRMGSRIAAMALDFANEASDVAEHAGYLASESMRDAIALSAAKASLAREKKRADRLSTAIRETRGILGATDGESVQEAAKRSMKAANPWRPVQTLVRDGRRIEVWIGSDSAFSRADFRNPGSITHYREVDPTKPEGVA